MYSSTLLYHIIFHFTYGIIQSMAGVNMEGARMYAACAALTDCLLQLGVGIDGGKDSLTMAAQV